MRPDFSKIDYKPQPREGEPAGPAEATPVWNTAEHIPVKAWFTADDLYAMEHLEYAAGVPPLTSSVPPEQPASRNAAAAMPAAASRRVIVIDMCSPSPTPDPPVRREPTGRDRLLSGGRAARPRGCAAERSFCAERPCGALRVADQQADRSTARRAARAAAETTASAGPRRSTGRP